MQMENSFHTLQSVTFSKMYLSFKLLGLFISSWTKAKKELVSSEEYSKKEV